MLKQKTLKDSFSLSGKGLHTGLDLTVTFNPAPDTMDTKSNVSTWKDSLPSMPLQTTYPKLPVEL